MKVRFLNTVYLSGVKHEREDGEFEWPDDMVDQAVELCERGYLELIGSTPPASDAAPDVADDASDEGKRKGKRGG